MCIVAFLMLYYVVLLSQPKFLKQMSFASWWSANLKTGSENTLENTVEKSPKIHLLLGTFQVYFGVYFWQSHQTENTVKNTPQNTPENTLTERVLPASCFYLF